MRNVAGTHLHVACCQHLTLSGGENHVMERAIIFDIQYGSWAAKKAIWGTAKQFVLSWKSKTLQKFTRLFQLSCSVRKNMAGVKWHTQMHEVFDDDRTWCFSGFLW